jgi:hypothetical protein
MADGDRAVARSRCGKLRASPEPWEQFRNDVERTCLAVAVSLDQPKIFVNPFGTESYGVAMLIGAEKGGDDET